MTMKVVVFITAKDKEEGQKIARHLLQEKLAACVNVVDGVQSFFWWDGKIDESQEVLLVAKTKKSLFTRIVKAVRSVHSYSVPEIIALPIMDGFKDYLKWINNSVLKEKKK